MLDTVIVSSILLLLLPAVFAFTAVPKAQRTTERIQHLSTESEQRSGVAVGIDLGTTYSAVAYIKDGVPTIIPVPGNGRTMPSVVTFDNENASIVGRQACEREVELGGAYRNVKRILGTGGKISPDTRSVVPFLHASTTGKTFKKDSITNQLHDAVHYPTMLKNKQYLIGDSEQPELIRPEMISAHVLRTLKEAAERHLGEAVTRAVIGVPAYFNDAQRQATMKAAEIAGISKVKLLREPEAAALAYGTGKEQIGMGDTDELVLVFDLGGGTFDVSILLVGGGITEIIGTSGNAQLGGSVFDARIAQYLLKVIRDQAAASTRKWSKAATNAVVLAAESIRIYLSNNRKVKLAIPVQEKIWSQMEDASSVILPKDFNINETITCNSTHVVFQFLRKDMETLCKEDFQALLRPIREVAIMSGALLPGDSSPSIVDAALELEKEEQTITPIFANFYDEENGMETDKKLDSKSLINIADLDIQKAKKKQQQGRKRARDISKQERKFREEKRKLDETKSQKSDSEKVKVRDGISGRPISRVVLVGGATRMPGIGRLLEAVTGIVPYLTVNPDEAIALGCAVQAAILDGEDGMNKVLSPMQAAILRALAENQGLGDADESEFELSNHISDK
jgi:molecular chaperone DnaK (HSP70)